MKSKFFSLISLLLSGGFIFAQMPGMMTMQQASAPQGTTLGANTTSGAVGIALGNRVVMRGYVDFIYSTTNNNDSHFILEGITKKVKLKDTGFPQLAASDIIKHKVLMEYGSPKEFDGVWHIYEDINSTYKVRELDERNIKVETKSLQVTDKLEKAIDDTYSKQGIEYKKRLMVQGIDI